LDSLCAWLEARRVFGEYKSAQSDRKVTTTITTPVPRTADDPASSAEVEVVCLRGETESKVPPGHNHVDDNGDCERR